MPRSAEELCWSGDATPSENANSPSSPLSSRLVVCFVKQHERSEDAGPIVIQKILCHITSGPASAPVGLVRDDKVFSREPPFSLNNIGRYTYPSESSHRPSGETLVSTRGQPIFIFRDVRTARMVAPTMETRVVSLFYAGFTMRQQFLLRRVVQFAFAKCTRSRSSAFRSCMP